MPEVSQSMHNAEKTYNICIFFCVCDVAHEWGKKENKTYHSVGAINDSDGTVGSLAKILAK